MLKLEPMRLIDAELLYTLMDEAESLNLVVNNLFQVANDLWQCNLRDGNSMTFHSYGQARTPGGAMFEAMKEARPKATRRPTVLLPTLMSAAKPDDDFNDLV